MSYVLSDAQMHFIENLAQWHEDPSIPKIKGLIPDKTLRELNGRTVSKRMIERLNKDGFLHGEIVYQTHLTNKEINGSSRDFVINVAPGPGELNVRF